MINDYARMVNVIVSKKFETSLRALDTDNLFMKIEVALGSLAGISAGIAYAAAGTLLGGAATAAAMAFSAVMASKMAIGIGLGLAVYSFYAEGRLEEIDKSEIESVLMDLRPLFEVDKPKSGDELLTLLRSYEPELMESTAPHRLYKALQVKIKNPSGRAMAFRSAQPVASYLRKKEAIEIIEKSLEDGNIQKLYTAFGKISRDKNPRLGTDLIDHLVDPGLLATGKRRLGSIKIVPDSDLLALGERLLVRTDLKRSDPHKLTAEEIADIKRISRKKRRQEPGETNSNEGLKMKKTKSYNTKISLEDLNSFMKQDLLNEGLGAVRSAIRKLISIADGAGASKASVGRNAGKTVDFAGGGKIAIAKFPDAGSFLADGEDVESIISIIGRDPDLADDFAKAVEGARIESATSGRPVVFSYKIYDGPNTGIQVAVNEDGVAGIKGHLDGDDAVKAAANDVTRRANKVYVAARAGEDVIGPQTLRFLDDETAEIFAGLGRSVEDGGIGLRFDDVGIELLDGGKFLRMKAV